MAVTVLLTDIVDALEIQFDEMPEFLDLDSDQVITISLDLLRDAEESTEEEESEDDEEFKLAKGIVVSGRYLRLPSKYEVHEWQIMRDFADSVQSSRIRADLDHALHGRGAFRHFKSELIRHRIEPSWFGFRAEALRKIAIEWLEDNQISWT